MDNETILPCPYPGCGADGAIEVSTLHKPWIYCPHCSVAGPTMDDLPSAIAAWNSIPRQTKPAAPVPPEWVWTTVGDMPTGVRLSSVNCVQITTRGQRRRAVVLWFFAEQNVSLEFPTRAAALAFVAGLGLPVEAVE